MVMTEKLAANSSTNALESAVTLPAPSVENDAKPNSWTSSIAHSFLYFLFLIILSVLDNNIYNDVDNLAAKI